MNRIFKKVFNRKIGEYVVASETAKGNKKSTTGTKTAVAVLTAVMSASSVATTLINENQFAGINGTMIGKGHVASPTTYMETTNGWMVGSNQWYFDTNSIGTNELNTAEQREAGYLQGTIDNYSKNIGQANITNTLLSTPKYYDHLFGSSSFNDNFQDYMQYYTPNYFSNYSSMNSGYDEMFQQMTNSNINDALNQNMPEHMYNYSSRAYMANSATSFGGNNIFKLTNTSSYDRSSNQNAVIVGRDNGLNGDAKDTTVVGHNNTLDTTNVFKELYSFDSFSNSSEMVEPYQDQTYTYFFDQPIYTIASGYVGGSQSTVLGNNTVNSGTNNIIIGSTTQDRTNTVLAGRQAYLNSFNEVQGRLDALKVEISEAEERLSMIDGSDEDRRNQYKNLYDTYIPKVNALNLEKAQLLKSYMDKSSSLAAGITGNDSVSIGVNAKTISADDAWWNDLVVKATEVAGSYKADVTLNYLGEFIDISNPEFIDYFTRENVDEGDAISKVVYQDRTAHNQLAIGFNATSSHLNAVAVGTNAFTTEENSIAFGMNRVTNVGHAVDGTDAMTVGNLKALEGQFDYNEIIYQPYEAKKLNREHVQADVVQRSIDYGIQKDIIMNQELTAYLKEKTDTFISETVTTNSAIIETEVANFTANEIAKGKVIIDETISEINEIYANTKDEFKTKADNTTAQNLLAFTDEANKGLDDAAKDSIDAANDLLAGAKDKIEGEIGLANEKLGQELDQIADYEDEATDKRILAELINKTNGKNFGNGDGSTGGDGGSENANGMTDAFEDALNHLQAKDKETQDQLLTGFNDGLENANNDFNKELQGLDVQDQLLANKDNIQAEALNNGLDMLDAKDKATQLEVLNKTHELAKQSVTGVLDQAQHLNNTIEHNVVESASIKDTIIAQDLVATAASKDKEILDEVATKATEADLAVETAVKSAVDKADAETLASVTEHNQQLNTITKNASEAYASEQDKLVYNRMLEVLSAAPTSSISNVWKNINEGDQVVFDQSLDYIDSKDAETLAKAKDYADQKANSIDKAFNAQTKRLDAGVASAVAASMLGQSAVPGAHTLGVSVGVYGSEVGYAFGASTMTHDSMAVLKAGFTVNSKNRFGFMSGAGFYVD